MGVGLEPGVMYKAVYSYDTHDELMWMVAYSLAPAAMTSLHVALTLKLLFTDALRALHTLAHCT